MLESYMLVMDVLVITDIMYVRKRDYFSLSRLIFERQFLFCFNRLSAHLSYVYLYDYKIHT